MPDSNTNTKAEENKKKKEETKDESNKDLKGLYVTQSADINDDEDAYRFTGFKDKYSKIGEKFLAFGFPEGKKTETIDPEKPAIGFPVEKDIDPEDFCLMVQATYNDMPVESLPTFSPNVSMTGSKLSEGGAFSSLDGDLAEVDPNSDTQAAPGTGEAGSETAPTPGDGIDDPYLYFKMMKGYDPEDIQKLIDEY